MLIILAKLLYNAVIFSPFLLLAMTMNSGFGYCLYGALVLCHFKSIFHASKTDIKYIVKNTGKIGTYLINLDRAAERLQQVMPKLQELDFPVNRVAAVDGNELSDDYISAVADEPAYLKFFRMLPENGTIGCSLSHLKVWKEFLRSDNEFALICEDDITFDPQELMNTIKQLVPQKSMWDIVMFEVLHGGTPKEIVKLDNGKSLVVYLTNITHSGCYLINRWTAYRLIEKFYPIKMPIDHYFTASWEFGITLLGVEPRLVTQTRAISQIKTGGCKKINSKRLRFHNAKLNIERAILQTVYNSLIYAKFLWNNSKLTK